jgi:hypothetical protein
VPWCRFRNWVGQGIEAGERGGEVDCPGPSVGDAQMGSSGGAHQAGGDVQESVAPFLGLGHSVFARQEQVRT